jgi:membrane protein
VDALTGRNPRRGATLPADGVGAGEERSAPVPATARNDGVEAGAAVAADPAGGVTREAVEPHDITVTAPLKVIRRSPLHVANEVRLAMRRDNVTLLAAGVATFWMVALVPAIVALVSLYGLVADPAEVERQVRGVTEALPEEAQALLVTQFESIVETESSGLGLAAVIGLTVAVFSTSAGVKHLMGAINAAYEFTETRSYVALRARAMLLTFGLLVLAVTAIGTITLLPTLVAELGVTDRTRLVVGLVRWPVLAVAVLGSLSVFYQVAPNRRWSTWRWVTPGAVAATLVWLTASIGFSVYAANFGNFNETYGTLSAVVVMLLWLVLSAFSVVLGAELNAELERESDAPGTLDPRV